MNEACICYFQDSFTQKRGTPRNLADYSRGARGGIPAFLLATYAIIFILGVLIWIQDLFSQINHSHICASLSKNPGPKNPHNLLFIYYTYLNFANNLRSSLHLVLALIEPRQSRDNLGQGGNLEFLNLFSFKAPFKNYGRSQGTPF